MITCQFEKRKCSDEQLGLKYIPTIEPSYSDNEDYVKQIVDGDILVSPTDGNGQFSLKNGMVLVNVLNRINAKNIVEIGIARKHKFLNSSTHLLFDNKSSECNYYGIDLDGDGIEEYITYQPNINLLIGNSSDIKMIERIKSIGGIDLLHIDGDHSINGFLNDWMYVKFVNVGGFIVVHDTNNHPGPYLFYDAVDEKRFRKNKFFENCNDNGLAVFQKL